MACVYKTATGYGGLDSVHESTLTGFATPNGPAWGATNQRQPVTIWHVFVRPEARVSRQMGPPARRAFAGQLLGPIPNRDVVTASGLVPEAGLGHVTGRRPPSPPFGPGPRRLTRSASVNGKSRRGRPASAQPGAASFSSQGPVLTWPTYRGRG